MLIQQDNNSSIASYQAPLQTLASADETIDTRQPALALQVGSDLDSGIERKQRPNEDTLFITHGVMPSASGSPKPFALLMVADGMGGSRHCLCNWSEAVNPLRRARPEPASVSLTSLLPLLEEMLIDQVSDVWQAGFPQAGAG